MRYPKQRRQLLQWYLDGLKAVDGYRAVSQSLSAMSYQEPCRVVAIGKAAGAMMSGAREWLGENLIAGMVITKEGYLPPWQDGRMTMIESGHPLPDHRSLIAGEHLLTFLQASSEPLLFLISGGTSALVEVLPEGINAEQLTQLNQWLLNHGLDIEKMNRLRKSVSAIKAGRLATHLHGRRVTQLMIADVPQDDPKVIGSGLLVAHQPADLTISEPLPDWIERMIEYSPSLPTGDAFDRIQHHVIASNGMLLDAIAASVAEASMSVEERGVLAGNARDMGRQIAERLQQAQPGVYLWGGETTMRLPEQTGRGGRNQALALSTAIALQGLPNVLVLAAGSDGSDGPTEDAGALVDGDSVQRGEQELYDAMDCQRRADSGTFLEASGDLIATGVTGTNVMDVVIGWKLPQGV